MKISINAYGNHYMNIKLNITTEIRKVIKYALMNKLRTFELWFMNMNTYIYSFHIVSINQFIVASLVMNMTSVTISSSIKYIMSIRYLSDELIVSVHKSNKIKREWHFKRLGTINLPERALLQENAPYLQWSLRVCDEKTLKYLELRPLIVIPVTERRFFGRS